MSEIWSHHESKAQTYVKAIQMENKLKRKAIEKKEFPIIHSE